MLDLYSMSADPNPKVILRVKEVLRRTGLKTTMLYDLIGKQKFPKQVSLGARAVGFYEDEVEDWIRNPNSAKRKPQQPDQVVTAAKEMRPAPKVSRELVRKATKLQSDEPKPPANRAAPRSVARTAGNGRTPTITIDADDDIVEAMSESEELRLLRRENAQLKKLVGELVLKNSLLQPSTRLKSSAV